MPRMEIWIQDPHVEQRGRVTSLGWWALLGVMQPRMPSAFLLGGHITASWSAAGQLSTSPHCLLCPLEGDVTIKAPQHAGFLEGVCDNLCGSAV